MAKKKTTFFFDVEGRGSFPFDMLRYDRCWPTKEAEMRLVGDQPGPAHIETRRIQMQGLNEPTTGRWESFGWKVVPSSTRPGHEL